MSSDVASLLSLLFNVLSIAIVGRALLSWFDPGMNSSIGKVLYDITEPLIAPIRRVVPSLGMFDISPIIALLLLRAISTMIQSALVS